MTWEVLFMDVHFIDSRVVRFIYSLDKSTFAKVMRVVDLLKKYENNLRMPYSRPIKDGLYELRTRGTHEVRLFYIFYKSNVIILHGYVKKADKIPDKEFHTAMMRRKLIDKS